MATTHSQGAHVIVLDEWDFSALNSFLYEFNGDEEKLARIARENNMALGMNHIYALASLWKQLHGIKDSF